MIEFDPNIQHIVEQALMHQASGSWRSARNLGRKALDLTQPLPRLLLSALCANPLHKPEKCRDSLANLSAAAPRSAFALALSRSLLALAQEQIIAAQQVRAKTTLSKALACNVEAAAIVGMPIPMHKAHQLFGQADVLLQTIKSQLDLISAQQRNQLPAQLVLVLGMHRSGTSALSGLLVESGLDGPADMMPASDFNPKGFFESQGAMDINDHLLNDLESSWHSTAEIADSHWLSAAPAVEAWRSGMLKLLYESYPNGGRAVLKDPRLCMLMPAIRPWLESDLIPCIVFMPVRHPAEVADSLWAAQSITRSHGLILWIRHIFESERHTRGLKRLIIPYQYLIADPKAILRRCHGILTEDYRGGGMKPTLTMAFTNFIDPRLQHHHAHDAVPDWVIKEKADTLYAFALEVYKLLLEEESHSQRLFSLMDKLWIRLKVALS